MNGSFPGSLPPSLAALREPTPGASNPGAQKPEPRHPTRGRRPWSRCRPSGRSARAIPGRAAIREPAGAHRRERRPPLPPPRNLPRRWAQCPLEPRPVQLPFGQRRLQEHERRLGSSPSARFCAGDDQAGDAGLDRPPRSRLATSLHQGRAGRNCGSLARRSQARLISTEHDRRQTASSPANSSPSHRQSRTRSSASSRTPKFPLVSRRDLSQTRPPHRSQVAKIGRLFRKRRLGKPPPPQPIPSRPLGAECKDARQGFVHNRCVLPSCFKLKEI